MPYVVALLSVLGFVLFVHYHAGQVFPRERLLGIIDTDTPVYYSCARQWWQDGAGFFYSSPYSGATQKNVAVRDGAS